MCYVLPGGRELREIVRIVDVGIMKLDLPRMARTIFDICCRTWIYLDVLHFKYLKSFRACTLMIGGPPMIYFLLLMIHGHLILFKFSNSFANDNNIKLPRFFNSRFSNPNTATVAFVDQLLGEKTVSVFPRVRCHVSSPLFNHFNGTEFFGFVAFAIS